MRSSSLLGNNMELEHKDHISEEDKEVEIMEEEAEEVEEDPDSSFRSSGSKSQKSRRRRPKKRGNHRCTFNKEQKDLLKGLRESDVSEEVLVEVAMKDSRI